MIIKLPWPDAKLAPNRSNGKHWSGVSAIKAKAKSDAFMLTRAAIADYGVFAGAKHRIPLAITFNAPDKRRRDLDGCLSSAKAALDGVALALGVDDSQFCPLTLDYVAGSDSPGMVVQL